MRLVHLDDEMAQHRVAELERVLELGERLVVALDVHEHVVRLVHLLDRVGKLAPAPVLEAEIGGIAFDTQARLLAGTQLNTGLKLQGFLAAKSRRSRKLVLHVTNIEFIEGQEKETENASTAQR